MMYQAKRSVVPILLSMILVLTLIATVMPINEVNAETVGDGYDNSDSSEINWLEDFECELSGNNIILSKYKGKATELYIPSQATIDGKVYNVKLNNSCYMFFNYNESLRSVSFSEDIDTSNVTDMSEMFCNCFRLKNIDIKGFNTSNVTSMKRMFDGCKKLLSLDLSNFNTGNVTDMGGMFESCEELTSLDVSSFDTSSVTSMWEMFGHCPKLTSIDVSGFDTSKVTDMSGVFNGCPRLTSLDVSGFNTSNVTRMSLMFYNCVNLSYLDVSNFDTKNVNDMTWMFTYCSNLTNLDVSGFDTSNVTKMYDMFFACNKLEYLDLSNWDMGKVTEVDDYYMLQKCDSLNEINTPRNVIINIGLPATYYREKDIDEKYNELPMNSTNSFKLIKLKDKAVTGIRLDSDYKELKVGESFELVAKVEPEDATNKGVTWSSSNPSVVSVDDKGKVSALLSGEAIITATTVDGGYSASCTVVSGDTPIGDGQEMYRLYNTFSGEHLYSSDDGEISWLVGCGWNNEGVSWIAPKASTTSVYRLYNPNSGEHHYTTDAFERDYLDSVGWNYEGVGWYSADNNAVPVYRLFNPHTNIGVQSHVYTTDAGERDWLMSTGWNYEGIGWFGE